MKYINYLKNKNLSPNTIKIYIRFYNEWKQFINNKTPNKTLFVKYIKNYEKTHEANSVHLAYSSIMSIFRFERRWNLINQCKEINLPKIQNNLKTIITLNEFNQVKKEIEIKNKYEQRNWLIFSYLFLTGSRASEILEFNKNKIYDKNKIRIKGKGNKTRIIFIVEYLEFLLKKWRFNRIAITNWNKLLTIKQINIIVKETGLKYFGKQITCHSLRRSFATNLLKNNANIEIVKQALGHTNINTTARYLQFNDDDLFNEISSVFK